MRKVLSLPAEFLFSLTLLIALLHPLPSPAESIHREPLVSMELLLVEGGTYLMGDTFGEGLSAERPAHLVTVSDFHLGRLEVTVGQYRTFVEETGYRTDVERAGGALDIDLEMNTFKRREGISWKEPGFVQSDDFPVVWVSWNDASAFTRWLSEKTGLPYRLPTEGEWELAARERGQSLRWAGTSLDGEVGDYAWFSRNSGGRPHPGGGKKPNALGLRDLSGNVWEWCFDWQEPYGGTGSTLIDQAGLPLGRYKALRGGSWRVDEKVIRATYRNGYKPDYAHSSIGFRVALPGKKPARKP
jgi:sulfatase modifying factor 1